MGFDMGIIKMVGDFAGRDGIPPIDGLKQGAFSGSAFPHQGPVLVLPDFKIEI